MIVNAEFRNKDINYRMTGEEGDVLLAIDKIREHGETAPCAGQECKKPIEGKPQEKATP